MMKKKTLIKRYQTSYRTREAGNTLKKGVFNWRKLGDKEISFFNPGEGKFRINIIPYKIKTKNHPLVKSGDMEIGDMDYVMDVYVHRYVGATESSVICLKQTFGKPCPICEHMAKLNKEGNEEEAKSLKPSRRVIYNVEDLKEPGKVKVFETSHYLFERELIEEARDEEGGFVDFADPKAGKEIKFRAAENSVGQNKFNEYKSFSFEDRDEPISDELLEQAISFDEVLDVPSYDEVKKVLFCEDEETEAEDEPDEYEETEATPAESKKKKEVEEDEADEETEVEDEPEEDEKPQKSIKKKEAKGKCPYGHKFGIDADSHDDCDECDIWDSCVKAS